MAGPGDGDGPGPDDGLLPEPDVEPPPPPPQAVAVRITNNVNTADPGVTRRCAVRGFVIGSLLPSTAEASRGIRIGRLGIPAISRCCGSAPEYGVRDHDFHAVRRGIARTHRNSPVETSQDRDWQAASSQSRSALPPSR